MDPLGLYDYSVQETQQHFLDPAYSAATAGPVQGLLNIKNLSTGPYDFGWGHQANDTFSIPGQTFNADQFGNFIAGYEAASYDTKYGVSLALDAVVDAGIGYHLLGATKAINDPFDLTGLPDIFNGAAYGSNSKNPGNSCSQSQ